MKNGAISLALAAALTLSTHSLATPARLEQSSWSNSKKFVQLPNGIRMAYVELGDPAGPPLVLLHGFTDSSRSWSLVASHLAKYRLLIPDQRGHGDTTAPECCYSSTQLAYDMLLFLDALAIEKAGIAGHSMGSMAAIAFAADYPKRVSKVALLGSTALPPVSRGNWLWSNIEGLTFPIDRNSSFVHQWAPQATAVDPQFADAATSELLEIKPYVWRGVLRELTDVPVGRHAADVRAPVLILSGGRDPFFPAEHHQSLLKAFPSSKAYVYPEYGHNFLWDDPADVGRRLSVFFSAQ